MAPKYISTPIYYVNADPHIGHVHTAVMADILKRAEAMKGNEAFLTTGTDEHGQKNQEAAEAGGLPIPDYLSVQSQKFRTLFDSIDVSYDMWVRTTYPEHIHAVQEALRRLYDKGLIVYKEYSGLYCVGCEMYKTITDLDEQGRCPNHQQVPLEMKEENYFLTIGVFQQWLINLLNERIDWIQPTSYRNEVLAMLHEPLEDWCISRPKSRVSLGVELPFDKNYVTFVWFDALLNYISSLGWPDKFRRGYWEESTHLMAKDIIKTHCVYWPIMLKALDLPVPARFRVHGYWIGKGGRKMSKTLGNVVEPKAIMDEVGGDGLRFFLAKAMRSSDSQIYRSLVINTYNVDPVNKIGNLYSRVVKFVVKHHDSTIPTVDKIGAEDAALQRWVVEQAEGALAQIDLHTISEYVQTIVDISERMNKHFEAAAPWTLVRYAEDQQRLDSLLYASLDCLRILFELAYPIVPRTSLRALRNLGCPVPESPDAKIYFKTDDLPAGGRIHLDTVLFPRVKP